jgi:chemotaxis protein MotB
MARKKKCEECPPAAAAWLLTYGDMVTLLLTFFVMLFTTAKIDGREFRLILSAFNGSLGIFDGGQTLSKGKLEEMGMNLEALPSQTRGRQLSKSLNEAREKFKPLMQADKVRISEDERGIIISLVDVENFDRGSARLKQPIKDALDIAGPMLKDIPNFVRIEGHADTEVLSPLETGKERPYINSWDLAGARAINVTNYLVYEHNIPPMSMSAISFGSFRPLPVEENLKGTPEGKAINRRVDIIILAEKNYKRQKDKPKSKLPDSLIPGIEYKE